MKRTFTLLKKIKITGTMLLCMCSFSAVKAQTCKMLTDTIVSGDLATTVHHYYYNAQDLLIKVETIDSAEVAVNRYDTLIYSGGKLTSVEQWQVGQPTAQEIVQFTYDGSNRISRIVESGDRGNGPYTKAYDFTYNASGELTDIIYDNAAEVGSPEGFTASFENIVWTNGNPTYIELIGDLGSGQDTIELQGVYDSAPNIEKLMVVNEAMDVLATRYTNNLKQLTFINDEAMGNAGTIAISMDYTYDSEGYVLTRSEYKSAFQSRENTSQFELENCTAVISGIEEEEYKSFEIYPNPTHGMLNIDLGTTEHSIIRVINIQGQVLKQMDTSQMTLQVDLNDLPDGVYFVEVEHNQKSDIKKAIKF